MTMKCEGCGRIVACPACGIVEDDLERAVREDATTFRVEVQPMREPVDPDAKVLRAEIGPR